MSKLDQFIEASTKKGVWPTIITGWELRKDLGKKVMHNALSIASGKQIIAHFMLKATPGEPKAFGGKPLKVVNHAAFGSEWSGIQIDYSELTPQACIDLVNGIKDATKEAPDSVPAAFGEAFEGIQRIIIKPWELVKGNLSIRVPVSHVLEVMREFKFYRTTGNLYVGSVHDVPTNLYKSSDTVYVFSIDLGSLDNENMGKVPNAINRINKILGIAQDSVPAAFGENLVLKPKTMEKMMAGKLKNKGWEFYEYAAIITFNRKVLEVLKVSLDLRQVSNRNLGYAGGDYSLSGYVSDEYDIAEATLRSMEFKTLPAFIKSVEKFDHFLSLARQKAEDSVPAAFGESAQMFVWKENPKEREQKWEITIDDAKKNQIVRALDLEWLSPWRYANKTNYAFTMIDVISIDDRSALRDGTATWKVTCTPAFKQKVDALLKTKPDSVPAAFGEAWGDLYRWSISNSNYEMTVDAEAAAEAIIKLYNMKKVDNWNWEGGSASSFNIHYVHIQKQGDGQYIMTTKFDLSSSAKNFRADILKAAKRAVADSVPAAFGETLVPLSNANLPSQFDWVKNFKLDWRYDTSSKYFGLAVSGHNIMPVIRILNLKPDGISFSDPSGNIMVYWKGSQNQMANVTIMASAAGIRLYMEKIEGLLVKPDSVPAAFGEKMAAGWKRKGSGEGKYYYRMITNEEKELLCKKLGLTEIEGVTPRQWRSAEYVNRSYKFHVVEEGVRNNRPAEQEWSVSVTSELDSRSVEHIIGSVHDSVPAAFGEAKKLSAKAQASIIAKHPEWAYNPKTTRFFIEFPLDDTDKVVKDMGLTKTVGGTGLVSTPDGTAYLWVKPASFAQNTGETKNTFFVDMQHPKLEYVLDYMGKRKDSVPAAFGEAAKGIEWPMGWGVAGSRKGMSKYKGGKGDAIKYLTQAQAQAVVRSLKLKPDNSVAQSLPFRSPADKTEHTVAWSGFDGKLIVDCSWSHSPTDSQSFVYVDFALSSATVKSIVNSVEKATTVAPDSVPAAFGEAKARVAFWTMVIDGNKMQFRRATWHDSDNSVDFYVNKAAALALIKELKMVPGAPPQGNRTYQNFTLRRGSVQESPYLTVRLMSEDRNMADNRVVFLYDGWKEDDCQKLAQNMNRIIKFGSAPAPDSVPAAFGEARQLSPAAKLKKLFAEMKGNSYLKEWALSTYRSNRYFRGNRILAKLVNQFDLEKTGSRWAGNGQYNGILIYPMADNMFEITVGYEDTEFPIEAMMAMETTIQELEDSVPAAFGEAYDKWIEGEKDRWGECSTLRQLSELEAKRAIKNLKMKGNSGHTYYEVPDDSEFVGIYLRKKGNSNSIGQWWIEVSDSENKKLMFAVEAAITNSKKLKPDDMAKDVAPASFGEDLRYNAIQKWMLTEESKWWRLTKAYCYMLLEPEQAERIVKFFHMTSTDGKYFHWKQEPEAVGVVKDDNARSAPCIEIYHTLWKGDLATFKKFVSTVNRLLQAPDVAPASFGESAANDRKKAFMAIVKANGSWDLSGFTLTRDVPNRAKKDKIMKLLKMQQNDSFVMNPNASGGGPDPYAYYLYTPVKATLMYRDVAKDWLFHIAGESGSIKDVENLVRKVNSVLDPQDSVPASFGEDAYGQKNKPGLLYLNGNFTGELLVKWKVLATNPVYMAIGTTKSVEFFTYIVKMLDLKPNTVAKLSSDTIEAFGREGDRLYILHRRNGTYDIVCNDAKTKSIIARKAKSFSIPEAPDSVPAAFGEAKASPIQWSKFDRFYTGVLWPKDKSLWLAINSHYNLTKSETEGKVEYYGNKSQYPHLITSGDANLDVHTLDRFAHFEVLITGQEMRKEVEKFAKWYMLNKGNSVPAAFGEYLVEARDSDAKNLKALKKVMLKYPLWRVTNDGMSTRQVPEDTNEDRLIKNLGMITNRSMGNACIYYQIDTPLLKLCLDFVAKRKNGSLAKFALHLAEFPGTPEQLSGVLVSIEHGIQNSIGAPDSVPAAFGEELKKTTMSQVHALRRKYLQWQISTVGSSTKLGLIQRVVTKEAAESFERILADEDATHAKVFKAGDGYVIQIYPKNWSDLKVLTSFIDTAEAIAVKFQNGAPDSVPAAFGETMNELYKNGAWFRDKDYVVREVTEAEAKKVIKTLKLAKRVMTTPPVYEGDLQSAAWKFDTTIRQRYIEDSMARTLNWVAVVAYEKWEPEIQASGQALVDDVIHGGNYKAPDSVPAAFGESIPDRLVNVWDYDNDDERWSIIVNGQNFTKVVDFLKAQSDGLHFHKFVDSAKLYDVKGAIVQANPKPLFNVSTNNEKKKKEITALLFPPKDSVPAAFGESRLHKLLEAKQKPIAEDFMMSKEDILDMRKNFRDWLYRDTYADRFVSDKGAELVKQYTGRAYGQYVTVKPAITGTLVRVYTKPFNSVAPFKKLLAKIDSIEADLNRPPDSVPAAFGEAKQLAIPKPELMAWRKEFPEWDIETMSMSRTMNGATAKAIKSTLMGKGGSVIQMTGWDPYGDNPLAGEWKAQLFTIPFKTAKELKTFLKALDVTIHKLQHPDSVPAAFGESHGLKWGSFDLAGSKFYTCKNVPESVAKAFLADKSMNWQKTSEWSWQDSDGITTEAQVIKNKTAANGFPSYEVRVNGNLLKDRVDRLLDSVPAAFGETRNPTE